MNTWLHANPRSLQTRIEVGVRLARRIARLHDSGIIHGNLSPACVWISDENLQVSDFGTACCDRWDDFWADSPSPCTAPAYASPESLHGKKYGPKQDMYAFGALLYLLLAGRPPFKGLKLLVRQVIPEGVLPPRIRKAPQPLYDAVTACLAGDPFNRPTAHEAADILKEYGGGDDQEEQIVFSRSCSEQSRQRIMVFIKDDERAVPLFDAALQRASAEPSLFLFVGLAPANLPSGHLERFKASLYRKLGQGLMRCRRHHLTWSLRFLETSVPEHAALELVRQYRPDRVYLGRQTSRRASSFSRSFQRAQNAGRVQVTYIV